MAAEKTLRRQPLQQASSPSSLPLTELHARLSNLRGNVFVPDHISPIVRRVATEELTRVLRNVADENTPDSWEQLQLFSFSVLGMPKKAKAAKKSISQAIRFNLKEKILQRPTAA